MRREVVGGQDFASAYFLAVLASGLNSGGIWRLSSRLQHTSEVASGSTACLAVYVDRRRSAETPARACKRGASSANARTSKYGDRDARVIRHPRHRSGTHGSPGGPMSALIVGEQQLRHVHLRDGTIAH